MWRKEFKSLKVTLREKSGLFFRLMSMTTPKKLTTGPPHHRQVSPVDKTQSAPLCSIGKDSIAR